MRKKEERCVLTFSTTTYAIALQVACEKVGLVGRLIPLPSQVRAGCGLAWCCAPKDQEQVLKLAEIEGILVEECELIELFI